MTTVTSTNEVPTIPAWLDLDAIVSPDLRQRMTELTHSGRILGAEVREWAIQAFKVSREYNKALREAGARDYDLGDLLGPVSGYSDLFDAAADMSEDAGVLGGNVEKPSWVDNVAPEYLGKQLDEAVS